MRRLVLSCLVSLGLLGCFRGGTPEAQARADLFACRVTALAPIVSSVLDAEELVRALYLGQTDLSAVLATLQASQLEVASLQKALRLCAPDEVEGAQSKVVAPPPAYGNKIL